MGRWIKQNALSVVMFAAFVVFLFLQTIFGWQSNNERLAEHGAAAESYLSYVGSGDFIEAVFENWESEFLQMASFVLLTAFLVQKGSPESKPPDADGEKDKSGDHEAVTAASPWPARRGGAVKKAYENSLVLALVALFVGSFVLHLLGGTAQYNEEQAQHGGQAISVLQFLGNPEFWFQSMQNWQSEFLSVGVLIVLGIVLRQRGSSQSKAVEAPHSKTGS